MIDLLMQQAANAAFQALSQEIAANPVGFAQSTHDVLGELFKSHHHTGYDSIQDIWDAVEGGHISHSAALQATAILAADLEKRSQRSAQVNPPRAVPDGQGAPVDVLSQIFQR